MDPGKQKSSRTDPERIRSGLGLRLEYDLLQGKETVCRFPGCGKRRNLKAGPLGMPSGMRSFLFGRSIKKVRSLPENCVPLAIQSYSSADRMPSDSYDNPSYFPIYKYQPDQTDPDPDDLVP